MNDLKRRLLSAFRGAYDRHPDIISHAPGRVNLIGEHTDYNDGFVLPMAIGCGTMVAASPRSDRQINLYAADLQSRSSFALDDGIRPDADQPWSNYVRGVAHALIEEGLALSGADIAIAGNVPKGAGLSSSASLEMASGLLFATMAGQADYGKTKLALAGQRAEHEFAGCNCGIMDQLVSAKGEAGSAVLIDCRSLETTEVAMPSDVAVMIVHSGVERGLVDGEYNLRRQQCEAAARHYGVKALRDLDESILISGKAGLDITAYRRARHVVTENARTLAASEALRSGDLVRLGNMMEQSHASMRDDFEITVPAIDALVDILQAAIGVKGGARMTGGGFGGGVVAIMRRAEIERIISHVEGRYRTPSGKPPIIMVETASAGASILAV